MSKLEKSFFEHNKERLSTATTKSKNQEHPTHLFLHGAGTSDKSRAFYLMEKLQDRDVSSFTFDFSGHGESTGSMEKSSLQKRSEEAISAMQFLATDKPITVIGSSMGGHIAMKLLEQKHNIGTVILFAPALYDKRAYSIPFGDGFSEIIREPESWKNTDIFSSLQNFTGKLLIFIGENDEVIPKEVIALLDKHSTKTQKKEIVVIPECTHAIHRFITQKPELADKVTEKILEFL